MSRTDFEAAYIERYGHRPRGWNDDFQVYQDAHANGAWFGWQARAAGIEAKAAPVGEREAFEKGYAQYAEMTLAEVQSLWDGDFYQDQGLRDAWYGFQAGAAHQRQQAREVVMPERKVAQHGDVLSFQGEGWNACLDEFARLNKGAGSHE